MTGYYLYCVTRPDNAPGPTLAGMSGNEVRSLGREGLVLWAEPADRRPEVTVETIRTHHRVVEAAAAEGPVLPLRFGQWVEDAGAAEEALSRSGDLYREGLERVEGAVEVGVRIGDPDARPLPEPASAVESRAGGDGNAAPGRGRAYLEALRERERERDRREERGRSLARELAAELGPVVRAERLGTPEAEGDLVSVAHLVDREDLDRHEEAVEDFRQRHPGLRIVRNGPWPPYSFTPGDAK